MMAEYIYASDGALVADENGNIYIPRKSIVRCKDCKYAYGNRRRTSTGWMDVLMCENIQWSKPNMVKDNGFCAWGKLRANK